MGAGGRRVRLRLDGNEAELHPVWLRDRSQEPGQVEPTNRQRLYTPRDLPADLGVVSAAVTGADLTGAL